MILDNEEQIIRKVKRQLNIDVIEKALEHSYKRCVEQQSPTLTCRFIIELENVHPSTVQISYSLYEYIILRDPKPNQFSILTNNLSDNVPGIVWYTVFQFENFLKACDIDLSVFGNYATLLDIDSFKVTLVCEDEIL